MCGLKSFGADFTIITVWSHPARGVWIEIYAMVYVVPPALVAPREGCVD